MSTSGSGPAPGWYDDPADPTQARYWDGEQWTSRVRPKDSPTPPPPSYASEPSFTTPASAGQAPANYLAQAILTTLFCCLPLGIVAIVKASQVNGLWQGGQREAAYKASAEAKRWAWIAFGVGLGVIALYTVFIIAVGVGTETNSNNF